MINFILIFCLRELSEGAAINCLSSVMIKIKPKRETPPPLTIQLKGCYCNYSTNGESKKLNYLRENRKSVRRKMSNIRDAGI